MASESPDVKNTSPGTSPASRGWFKRAQDWWYYEFRKIVGAWVFVVVLITVASLSIAVVDATDYVFSTMTFCGNACHVMESTVYKELQESKHWNTPTGVRATCADCHVSGRLSFAMMDHFVGTGELFVWATNDFHKPGLFEKFRPAAADRARFQFFENDSAKCRGCHVMEGIKPSRIRGQNAHGDAMEKGATSCIVCHFNLVHKEVEPSPEFLAAIEEYLGAGEEEEAVEKELPMEPDEEGEVL